MTQNSECSLDFFGIRVDKLTYQTFLIFVEESIASKQQIVIGYANADVLNKTYLNDELKRIFGRFDLIHPDGVGIYLASKFLYGKLGFTQRITGSDFYAFLLEKSVKNNWKIFFFGHTSEILSQIGNKNPELNICGIQEGYDFKDSDVISKINKSKPDLLIIGLSSPIQEVWINKYREQIQFGVTLLVGDGIKVFAGGKKRGPVFMRKAGLEWLVRLLSDPVKNFRKYAVGIPLFIFRITSEKLRMLRKKE